MQRIVPPLQEKRSVETIRGALEEIRRNRPNGSRRIGYQLSDEELLNRIHGGWLGGASAISLADPSRDGQREWLRTF